MNEAVNPNDARPDAVGSQPTGLAASSSAGATANAAEHLPLERQIGEQNETANGHFESVEDGGQSDAAPSSEELSERQVTLRQILLLMVFVSLLLAASRWVRPDIFAGALGIATLLGLILLHNIHPSRAILNLAWSLLAVMYLAACVFALFNPALWRGGGR